MWPCHQRNHKIDDLRNFWPVHVEPSERYPMELFDEHDNAQESEGLDPSKPAQLWRDLSARSLLLVFISR